MAEDFLILRGTVSVGMGKAADFLSMPGYRKGFKSAIGYVPYPGTLNIKLFRSYVRKASGMGRKGMRLVRGFSAGGKRFGRVRCYEAVLNGRIGVFVIRPERSRYPPSILELVSRKRLKPRIKAGSTVSVGVRLH